jgi:hypothetical protein
LLPCLAANAIPGSRAWPVVRFTPDAWGKGDPFDALAGALIAEPLRLDGRGLVGRLRQLPGALRALLESRLAALPHWAEALIVIDQFEELFTRVQDEELRRAFAAMLAETARSRRVRTVIAMRADFFHCVAGLPVLAALLTVQENRTFPLSAPGPLELHEMISGPAQVAGLQFEEGLARQVLDDTGDDPGALALMAYALQQLYEKSRAREGRLTWDAYRGFGGVPGAIGAQAGRAFDALGAAAQATLPAVFRELVEVDERGPTTRKRAPLSAVACDDAALRLVNALTDARLLVQSAGECGDPIVEVAHEALFSSWPRLKTWVEEARDDLVLLRQVRVAAQLWADRERHPAYLWPEERLKPVYAMMGRLQPPLSPLENDFIHSEFDRLVEEIGNPNIIQQRRWAIGERLAAIGDRRPGVGLVTVPLPSLSEGEARQGALRLWGEEHAGLPDIVWLLVGGGQVTLEDNAGVFAVEPFYIAKYPVTYFQYRAFVEADEAGATRVRGRDWRQPTNKEADPANSTPSSTTTRLTMSHGMKPWPSAAGSIAACG